MSSPSRGIYIFHESSDSSNTMYFRGFDGQTWTAETQVQNPALGNAPSPTNSTATAVAFQGALWYFSRYQNQLYFNVQNEGVWQTADPVGVMMSGTPSAVVWNDEIHIFYQGYGNGGDSGDNQLHYVTWNGSNFSGDNVVDFSVAGGMLHSPSALVNPASNQIEIYRQVSINPGQLRLIMRDPDEGWLGDWPLWAPAIANSPSAILLNGEHMVFFQGADQNGNPDQTIQYVTLPPGDKYWTAPQTVPDTMPGSSPYNAMSTQTSPSVVVLNGCIYCFYRIWGNDQTLLCAVRLGTDWQTSVAIPGEYFWDSPGAAAVT